MPTAFVRDVSPAIVRCELTHAPRLPIDFGRAKEEHAAYKRALERLGARVLTLPGGEGFPDGAFVEDLAVVVEEAAVLNRLGAESRRREVDALAEALRGLRRVERMSAPATLDGGDVLRVGRTLYAGRSSRTNAAGIAQLEGFLGPHGYRVRPVGVSGCLHLKTGCSYLGRGVLLANRAWVDVSAFEGLEVMDVHPEEPGAANAVLLGGRLLFSSRFPRTLAALRGRGFDVEAVDNAELLKAESGLTCLSVILD